MDRKIQYDEIIRPVNWGELNQLKKDILWVYDENYTQISAAFLQSEWFTLDYHEYLFLLKDEYFTDHDFYIEGVLVILLAACIEYIDTNGGDPRTLKRLGIKRVQVAVQKFMPQTDNQMVLKERVLFGLEIADTLSENDLLTTDLDLDERHPGSTSFYENINALVDDIIKAYYKSKLN